MQRRVMMLAAMLLGGLCSRGQLVTTTVTAPVSTPEPATLGELGAGLTGLLGYGWWRVTRRKRKDS